MAKKRTTIYISEVDMMMLEEIMAVTGYTMTEVYSIALRSIYFSKQSPFMGLFSKNKKSFDGLANLQNKEEEDE